MEPDDDILKEFLEAQARDHGCKEEIDQGLWLLFAISADDSQSLAMARHILESAPFAHKSGESEDDEWMLYYVDTDNKPVAVHWLEDRVRVLEGQYRLASPAQKALLPEMLESKMPHRIAQQLADLHFTNELSAGMIDDPTLVRGLLDRLHQREPLFFAAFRTLLLGNLFDLEVLFDEILAEDIQLENEIVKASLSKDPFLQARQNTAVEIRSALIRFHVINPLDQQKSTMIANRYNLCMEIERKGDLVTAIIDGRPVEMTVADFLTSIRSVRKNLYRGGEFSSFNTQAPWMTEAMAYPFRCIKQRISSRTELSPMDGLYMLERALE